MVDTLVLVLKYGFVGSLGVAALLVAGALVRLAREKAALPPPQE